MKKSESEFERFKNLTRNPISVSNIEVREKMAEEKRQKKTTHRRSSTPRKSSGVRKQTSQSR